MRVRLYKSAILAVLSGVITLAQAQHPGRSGAPGGAPAGPSAMAARRVLYLHTFLNPTGTQAKEASNIYTNAAATLTPPQKHLFTAHTELRNAVKSGNEAGMDQLSASTGNLTGQITAIHSKAGTAFYNLLSADQKTKYDEFCGGRFGGPGRRGPTMGPPGPPPQM